MKNAQFAFLLLVGCQQKEQQQIESPEDSAQTVDDSGEASDTEEPADEPADETDAQRCQTLLLGLPCAHPHRVARAR